MVFGTVQSYYWSWTHSQSKKFHHYPSNISRRQCHCNYECWSQMRFQCCECYWQWKEEELHVFIIVVQVWWSDSCGKLYLSRMLLRMWRDDSGHWLTVGTEVRPRVIEIPLENEQGIWNFVLKKWDNISIEVVVFFINFNLICCIIYCIFILL